MSTRTRADLVVKILEKLGVVPEGQPPETEDTARIDRNLPALFDELAGREIVYVADIENIPSVMFLSLAKVAAYELRNEFGIMADAAAVALKAENDEAIGNLKVILRGRPTYEPLRTLSY